jgi:hypothetical protein
MLGFEVIMENVTVLKLKDKWTKVKILPVVLNCFYGNKLRPLPPVNATELGFL